MFGAPVRCGLGCLSRFISFHSFPRLTVSDSPFVPNPPGSLLLSLECFPVPGRTSAKLVLVGLASTSTSCEAPPWLSFPQSFPTLPPALPPSQVPPSSISDETKEAKASDSRERTVPALDANCLLASGLPTQQHACVDSFSYARRPTRL